MDAVPKLPTVIPPEVEMTDISEKQGPGPSNMATVAGPGTSVEEILSAAGNASGGPTSGPIVIIMVGMAGSGKTTLTQRLTAELLQRNSPPYIINLDPACRDPPYPVNIDIRDTVKYKKVMEVYSLGPNGAIVTSLNLFATKFAEVLDLIKEKRKTHKYVIIDTPGQIEVFMWSASGNIITESLAALFPTVMIYVTDLVCNINPMTFISNMTYACSILYKTKLPLILALNKSDLIDGTYAKEWITDFEAISAALVQREDYAANLASSLSLGLEVFYNSIEHAVVSAANGEGMEEFFISIGKAVNEYETIYRPMYEQSMKRREKKLLKKKKTELEKIKKDITSGTTDEESCFVLPGRDAGAGLSLRLDDEENETSSDDEAEEESRDQNEEASFGEFFIQESGKRKEKVDQSAPQP